MRKITALLAMAMAVGGCHTVKKTFGIKDAPPAHREPTTTSIYGDWVLSNPDATAFSGASLVELTLNQSSFAINARYPSRAPVMVSGTVSYDAGLLTLTPTGGSTDLGNLSAAFVTGQPIVVVASAAGGSLVFAPRPSGVGTVATPSSIWNKKSQAEAAGTVVKP